MTTPWTDEIITSRKGAEAFLDQHIAATIKSASRAATHHTAVTDSLTSWQYLHYTQSGTARTQTPLVIVNLSTCDDQVTIEDFRVAPVFQHRAYGRKLLKAAIGVAYEVGANSLKMEARLTDGAGFWPSMGALPTDVPTKLANVIGQTLEKNALEFNMEEIARIKALQKLAEQNPMVAWRVLSQSKIAKLDGYYFKDDVFRTGWKGTEMTLPLTNDGTLVILDSRVGAIPDFAPTRPFVPGSNVHPLKPTR